MSDDEQELGDVRVRRLLARALVVASAVACLSAAWFVANQSSAEASGLLVDVSTADNEVVVRLPELIPATLREAPAPVRSATEALRDANSALEPVEHVAEIALSGVDGVTTSPHEPTPVSPPIETPARAPEVKDTIAAPPATGTHAETLNQRGLPTDRTSPLPSPAPAGCGTDTGHAPNLEICWHDNDGDSAITPSAVARRVSAQVPVDVADPQPGITPD